MSYTAVDVMLEITKVEIEGLTRAPHGGQVKLWCLSPFDTGKKAIWCATTAGIKTALHLFCPKSFEVTIHQMCREDALERLDCQAFGYMQCLADSLD